MARFNASEIDNYGSNGSSTTFFSLKNDKDKARIRLLYNSEDEIMGFSVHQIEVNGKKRWINCLREHGDPIDTCPLCDTGHKVMAKFFLLVWNEDAKEIQIWERGKQFWGDLQALFPKLKGTIVSNLLQVTRFGKPRDTQTRYDIYPLKRTKTTIDGILERAGVDELPELLGGFIINEDFENINYYLDNGSFPNDGQDDDYEDEDYDEDYADDEEYEDEDDADYDDEDDAESEDEYDEDDADDEDVEDDAEDDDFDDEALDEIESDELPESFNEKPKRNTTRKPSTKPTRATKAAPKKDAKPAKPTRNVKEDAKGAKPKRGGRPTRNVSRKSDKF